jgi:hypothetical protein
MRVLLVILLLGFNRGYAADVAVGGNNTSGSVSNFDASQFLGMWESNIVNNVKKVTVSPDKALKAIIFQRDCGALCSFNRQIIVIKNSEVLPKHDFPGNFFYAENKEGAKIDLLPKIKVTWLSTNELHIKYPSDLEVTTNSPTQPIKVTYETFMAK